ncbi:hypothetical protein D3C86_1720990 [compost metagenome]
MLLHALIANTRLEIREFRPAVERGPADVGVEMGGRAFEAALVQAVGGAGLARVSGRRVGTTGDRAEVAQAQLGAFLIAHRDDVDALHEGRGFQQLRLQLLLDRRGDGELLGRIGDAVQKGDAAGECHELDAGIVLHGGSERSGGRRGGR